MDCILVLNAGSSTLKFALFKASRELPRVCHGHVDFHNKSLAIYDAKNNVIHSGGIKASSMLVQLKLILKLIEVRYPGIKFKVFGHRVVHGGKNFLRPTLITKPVLKQLKSLVSLAPLHMPHEVSLIEEILRGLRKIPQIACFDTSFHRTQPRLATLFAIPRHYTDKDGIIRYGFHGLSYEYIMSKLVAESSNVKSNKIIVAHLGNGASLCAIHNNKSIATSMGFSSLDGLVMGTRCGSIDPGVLLYFMEEQKLSAKEVERMLYKESGLLGVSGISGDMRKLIASTNPNAKEAIDLFCYRAVREIGSLISVLGGIDRLVFTGGIGAHASPIRSKICKALQWAGVELDNKKNKNHAHTVSTAKSKVKIQVMPTDEEVMIAKHALGFIR